MSLSSGVAPEEAAAEQVLSHGPATPRTAPSVDPGNNWSLSSCHSGCPHLFMLPSFTRQNRLVTVKVIEYSLVLTSFVRAIVTDKGLRR